MYSIKDKLVVRGADALTDHELLTLMLDDVADAEVVAERILSLCGGDINSLSSVDIGSLRMVDGLTLRRASRVVAACEMGRRCVDNMMREVVVGCSEDVVKIMQPKLKGLKHEECWALHLNAANRVVEMQRVSQGGVISTTVDIRIIVKRSLELLATQIVLVHNHPSGSVEPSRADIDLTMSLRSAAGLFDISLVDHIIISSESDYSFVGGGLLK